MTHPWQVYTKDKAWKQREKLVSKWIKPALIVAVIVGVLALVRVYQPLVIWGIHGLLMSYMLSMYAQWLKHAVTNDGCSACTPLGPTSVCSLR